jgi:hypothetical protein
VVLRRAVELLAFDDFLLVVFFRAPVFLAGMNLPPLGYSYPYHVWQW